MRNTLIPIVISLFAGALAAQAQFMIQTRPSIATDVDPEFKIAVGDVNGDGFPDLVGANMGGTMPGVQNTLYLNDGFGGFVDVTATHLPQVVDWTGAVALGDVDFDGDLDIFFGNTSTQPSSLYLNDGTGHFTDVTATQMPALARTIYAAKFVDFDRDGDLDIIAREKILVNDGLGNFTDLTTVYAPPAMGAINAWGMAVGDLNGDGAPDVMFGINSNVTLPVLWLNNGQGYFTNASGNLPGPLYVGGDFSFGDVDFDGDLDVFVQGYARQSQLWLNDGTGVFTNVTATNLPALVEFCFSSALADLDLDGDLDIVEFVGANVAGQTRILRNSGLGVFTLDLTAAPTVTMSSSCGAVADLDLDGDLDLVFGNWNTINPANSQNSVWLNLQRHCQAPVPPTLGNVYGVEFSAQPYANASTLLLPFLSLQAPTAPVSIPGLGWTVMPAVGLQPLGIGLTTAATGTFTLQLGVPNLPTLCGLPLLLQALVVEPFGLALTNTFGDVVQ